MLEIQSVINMKKFIVDVSSVFDQQFYPISLCNFIEIIFCENGYLSSEESVGRKDSGLCFSVVVADHIWIGIFNWRLVIRLKLREEFDWSANEVGGSLLV